METTKDLIEPLLPKKLEIIIHDEKDNIIVIDWAKMEAEHDETMKKVEGMSEDERNDYLSYNETDLMQIFEYFITGDCESKVDDKEWLPFGLLGLCHNPDSFAEMSNNGLLLFDMTQKDKNDPPVILWYDDESETIAKHFSELKITKVK
jgi:hypothetical protein